MIGSLLRRLSCAALALGLIGQASAQTEMRVSTGVDFSSGDFGAPADTDILSVPFRATISAGDLEFSASTSFVSVRGTGDVIPGDIGPIITFRCLRLRDRRPDLFERFCRRRLEDLLNQAQERTTNSGIGDTVLGITWSLPAELTGDWLVDLGARVKLPTASASRGLGTGETDGSFSLDIARSVGAWTLYAGGGYRIFGDPTLDGPGGAPLVIDLENGASASAGLIYLFADGSSLSLGYDYLARTVQGSSAAHEVTLGYSTAIGDSGWSWTGYGVAGLSRASPDFAVGMSLSYGFDIF
ncbi:MAG: hypothetical protein ACE5ED_08130 [Rhodothalassiaceae bacterium]